MREQPGRENGVIEAERLELALEQAAAVRLDVVEQLLIRLAQMLHEGQEADVLHEAGEEGLVAGDAPVAFGQLAGGDRFDERPPPVAGQDARFQVGE